MQMCLQHKRKFHQYFPSVCSESVPSNCSRFSAAHSLIAAICLGAAGQSLVVEFVWRVAC